MRSAVVVVLVACSHGKSPHAPDASPDGSLLGIPAHGCVRFGDDRSVPLHESGTIADLALGDLDGDGKTDLALTKTDGTIAIRLGFGNGAFATDLPAFGHEAGRLALGDLDRDGTLDLVAAPLVQANNPVTVFLGKGDGTFGAGVNHLGYGTVVGAVALADVDNDGTLDIVALGDMSIFVGRGLGAGAFAAPIESPIGGLGRALVLVDLDHDGKLDAAVTRANGLAVLAGDGQGHFGSLATLDTSTDLQALDAADVDGDGARDLVIADGTGVAIAYGHGDRTFDPPARVAAIARASGVFARDLDRDQRLDLLVAYSTGVAVVRQRAPRTFDMTAFRLASGQQLAVVPRFAVADLDGNGVVDIMTPVAAALSRGDGTFALDPQYILSAMPFAIASGDVDGDGRPDIVAGNGGDSTFTVLHGRSGGGFDAAIVPGSLNLTAIADLDADGRGDVVAMPMQGMIDVYRGGAGPPSSFPIGTEVQDLSIADVDRDGKLDLVAVDTAELEVLLGNGDATFRALVPTTPGGALPLTSAAIGDLDRDGIPDVVIGRGSGAVVRMLGTGDGTFTSPVDVAASGDLVTLADLDGDGMLDLVVGRSPTVVVLRGRGDGTFAPPLDLGITGQMFVRDIDGDQHPDLVVRANALMIALGNGDGTFEPPAAIDLGSEIPLDVHDVDGDHAPDIVVGEDQAISVLPNHSTVALCGP